MGWKCEQRLHRKRKENGFKHVEKMLDYNKNEKNPEI